MLTLEDINNHVYFLFRKSQAEAMRTPRLGKIHVSDLIKPCMRYVIYKKISTSSGMNTEELKSLYFGQQQKFLGILTPVFRYTCVVFIGFRFIMAVTLTVYFSNVRDFRVVATFNTVIITVLMVGVM